MLNRIKKRWNIKSNFQLYVILIVFAVTGFSTVYVRKLIFTLLGITQDHSLWFKVPLYILVIIPTYQILLLIVGTIFGQFKFAWEFEKKMLSHLINLKKR
jgi:hypothetical protein